MLHNQKARLLTAHWLEISSSGWLLCILGVERVCLPGRWITAAIENKQGPPTALHVQDSCPAKRPVSGPTPLHCSSVGQQAAQQSVLSSLAYMHLINLHISHHTSM